VGKIDPSTIESEPMLWCSTSLLLLMPSRHDFVGLEFNAGATIKVRLPYRLLAYAAGFRQDDDETKPS